MILHEEHSKYMQGLEEQAFGEESRSIETTMELNQSPRVTNILVFQDHFTKHVLVHVTPNQTVKTIAKFLYGGYTSIFGASARLLSDQGTSFTSSIIEEL